MFMSLTDLARTVTCMLHELIIGSGLTWAALLESILKHSHNIQLLIIMNYFNTLYYF